MVVAVIEGAAAERTGQKEGGEGGCGGTAVCWERLLCCSSSCLVTSR